MEEYKEEQVLTRYIWNHYRHLMAPEELQLGKAIIGLEKANSASDPDTQQKMREKFSGQGNLPIETLLSDGFDSYRESVARRILSENAESVFINRCPKCHKIVGTPKARLCKWCGYNWFDESSHPHQFRNME